MKLEQYFFVFSIFMFSCKNEYKYGVNKEWRLVDGVYQFHVSSDALDSRKLIFINSKQEAMGEVTSSTLSTEEGVIVIGAFNDSEIRVVFKRENDLLDFDSYRCSDGWALEK